MVQTPTKSITLDDFLRLPETKPASEYVDGQIIQKPIRQIAMARGLKEMRRHPLWLNLIQPQHQLI